MVSMRRSTSFLAELPTEYDLIGHCLRRSKLVTITSPARCHLSIFHGPAWECSALSIIKSVAHCQSEFSAMRSLITFRASNNLLTGELPSQYSLFTNINFFGCDNNVLSGTLPESYNQWTMINTISLFSNRLSGSIPPSWATAMMRLSLLYFSNNSFSGTLPLNSFPVLLVLSVSFNNLSGTLPPSSTWPHCLLWMLKITAS